MAGQDATPEVIEAIREANGLKEPFPIQYAIWVGNVLRVTWGGPSSPRRR